MEVVADKQSDEEVARLVRLDWEGKADEQEEVVSIIN